MVSADALLGHIEKAFANPTTAAAASANAPRFEGGSAGMRAASCHRCHAAVEVPLDVTVHRFTCAGCGVEQQVDAYVSDRERLEIDMARQTAGNEALKRLKAEGVACGKCAGNNPVPDDGSVQLVCRFCKATILLSDHVDPSAIARSRLRHGAVAMREEARRKQHASVDRNRVIAAVVVGLVVAVVVIVNLLGLTKR